MIIGHKLKVIKKTKISLQNQYHQYEVLQRIYYFFYDRN